VPAWATEQGGQPDWSLFRARLGTWLSHAVIEYWLGARRYRSPLYTPPASSKPSDYAGLPAAHTVATSGFTSLGCYNVFSSFPTW